MDYSCQRGLPIDPADLRKGFYTSGNNKFKGKMYSLYKWQWKIMRGDESLTNIY